MTDREPLSRRHAREVARCRALLEHGLALRERCASLQRDIVQLLRDSHARVQGLRRLSVQLDAAHVVCEGPLHEVPSSAPEVVAPPPRRRVLLVDDDALLLRAFSRLMRRHHDVATAKGGQEALAYLRAGERFDVMLCDLMMPEPDGVQVLAAVRAEFPAMVERFIVLTGGAATSRTRAFLAHVDVPVVSKPVALEALLAAVDERTRSK